MSKINYNRPVPFDIGPLYSIKEYYATPLEPMWKTDTSPMVLVKTNGGEGEYLVSSEGADCFVAILKALGYEATIEDIDRKTDTSPTETF